MRTSFHYLLMANQALLHKRLLNGLSDTCLTMGQPKVLDYLKEHNGVSQKEIAAGCHIEAASLTSILSRMEEKGMIERKMLNGNRRSLYVFLTDFGKELCATVEQEFRNIEEIVFAGITEEERQKFMDTFVKIYGNLTSSPDAP
ncbi:MAG: MarR family transcriptional regulator [Lachnospiraceae bacterium]|nr:MarR family transcriptional regulator [Lachnospiraceae bacterium]